MRDDAELLRCYAKERAEEAFAELVRRHIDLVHSAALRQVNGDVHLAQDVTQLVFADLAKKARTLAGERVLAGWLFVSTRYAAAKLVRGEQRRRVREKEAHLRDALDGSAPVAWERVRPVLDEAMSELSAAEREALLLRFFEGRGFAEVGARLKLNENTARMRVARALDKLHGLLARRGVTSTSAALAAALGSQAVTAAPAGLAASVTGAALAGGMGAAAAGGLATFMGMTKLQLGLAGTVVIAGASGFIAQERIVGQLQRQIAALQASGNEGETLRAEKVRLTRSLRDAERAGEEDARLAALRAEAAELRRSLEARERAQAAALAARQAAEQESARIRIAAALEAAAKTPGGDRLPKVAYHAPLVYPSALMRAGTTGKAVIGVVVAADGSVEEAVAVESTHKEFEAAAIESVSQWKFEPGVKGHRAVNTRMEIPIVFALRDAKAGEPKPAAGQNWF